MDQARKIVLPLLLLAAAAGAAFYVLHDGGPAEPPVPVAPVVEASPATAPPQPAGPEQATGPDRTPDVIRTAPPKVDLTAHADAPQGIKGRVVLPSGAPAPDVPVYLMENSLSSITEIFLQNATGRRPPPASSGRTAADGTFALGVPQPGKTWDLRVVSDRHPEVHRQSLKIRDDEWYDTLDIVLEAGAVVTGRVIEEGSKAGVPEATVFLANSNQVHAILATPGRERGIAATTDAQGNFRFENAPKQGVIDLVAEANGYATAQLQNQPIKADGPNHFALEVVRGLPIGGIVVDQDGKPLPNVSITASGLSQKTPQTATTTSAHDGTFGFASLREGPYQLAANSAQFAEVKSPPVTAGELEIKLVMTQRAFAKLRVLGANKTPIRTYGISLKRFFANNPLGIGNVMEFADCRITPSDYPPEFGGEWAVVRGLPAGEFVFQITDNAHAKTLSPSFTIQDGGAPPEVEATLTLGAAITGTVIDDRGQPVADASVSTDRNGGDLFQGSPFGEFLGKLVPEKHSKAQVRTDAQGRFRIVKLAFAEYMVRIVHRDFCEGAAFDVRLESEGQVVDVGVVQLARGAVVDGATTVGGVPMGQIKVTLTVPQAAGAPVLEQQAPAAQAPLRAPFVATAISDNDGRFVLLKRVPPGTYKVFAARAPADGNPFGAILDIKETEREITVAPGQERVQLDFNLTKR